MECLCSGTRNGHHGPMCRSCDRPGKLPGSVSPKPWSESTLLRGGTIHPRINPLPLLSAPDTPPTRSAFLVQLTALEVLRRRASGKERLRHEIVSGSLNARISTDSPDSLLGTTLSPRTDQTGCCRSSVRLTIYPPGAPPSLISAVGTKRVHCSEIICQVGACF